MTHFGAMLRALRVQRGLSAYRLSMSTGISQPNISQIEAGKRGPTKLVMTRLSGVFPPEDIRSLCVAAALDHITELSPGGAT
jgi:transcriptional regulator with XRE-family HTH domain